MEKIENFIKEILQNDYSGHDYNHAKRVYQNALIIINALNTKENVVSLLDQKIILTSALIHDTIDHKLFNDELHQIIIVKNFLISCDYQEEEIQSIIEIIKSISFSKGIKLSSLNSQIVSDADKLDAIGAIGIIRTIEYGAIHKRKFYNSDDNEEVTLDHFYDKLLKLKDLFYTQVARDIAIKRNQFMISFLDEFYFETGIKPKTIK